MAERLPPVEKLPLALRKNAVFRADLLTLMRVSLPKSYFKGAIWQFKNYESSYGEEGLKELNDICHAHVLTMDVDLNKRFTYGGVDVDERGALRMLFSPDNLGCNIDYCVERDTLLKALNNAPAAPGASGGAISFATRTGIRQDYDPKIEAIRAKIAELLAWPEIQLNPNWEEVFAALKAESQVKKTELREDWQAYMGSMAISYFEGLLSQIQWQKFDDDLLQEGFRDAVSKGEVKFRIVEKLKDSSYSECEVEDGILYLQSTAKTWGTNTSYTAEKLVDKL
ncbi:uncharacterized protein PG986_012034 [Apiospora aurea]|uniref:Uncharacterized protein n=1 Tax=Apiospora aurea TaxID=335848 RepID=A0ABR1Q007_9PEZI